MSPLQRKPVERAIVSASVTVAGLMATANAPPVLAVTDGDTTAIDIGVMDSAIEGGRRSSSRSCGDQVSSDQAGSDRNDEYAKGVNRPTRPLSREDDSTLSATDPSAKSSTAAETASLEESANVEP
ncbi:MAG: hypothetical protein ACK5Q5_14095 [Planctomycetaceae bacterium]